VFNINTGELMVIIIIAILVVGPKRMLEIGQTVGRLTRRGRKIWGEVMSTIQTELQDTQQVVEEIAADGSALSAEVEATGQEAGAALQKSKTETFNVQAELKAIGQETQQVMKEVTEGFASIISGNVELEEEEDQDEEATGQKALQEDTPQVTEKATEEFDSIISGVIEPEEDQDEEATGQETSTEE
jgi:sec-independent protein translocase protein TatB